MSLERYIKTHGAFSGPLASDILLQLAEAVAFLHEIGISPRDIKSENIAFYANTHRIKLFDLGLAYHVEPGESSLVERTWSGTPIYMAPEVLHRRKHERRAVGREEITHGMRTRKLRARESHSAEGERSRFSDFSCGFILA